MSDTSTLFPNHT